MADETKDFLKQRVKIELEYNKAQRISLFLKALLITLLIFMAYFLGGVVACKAAGGVWGGFRCLPRLLILG